MAPLLRKRGGGTPKGQEKSAEVKKWRKESKSEVVAGPADVLLGRGKGAYEWQGNIRYQQIICYSLPAYTAAKKKQEKTQISNSIVNAVKQNGGRFLKETRDGGVCEVSDKEAREKVAHALRHRRRVSDKEAREKVAHALRHRRRICEGQKGPMDFTLWMFSGNRSNESRNSRSFTQYRDPEPSSIRSNRTDDTEPVVSHRSDRTDYLEAEADRASPENSDFDYDEVRSSLMEASLNDEEVEGPSSSEQAKLNFQADEAVESLDQFPAWMSIPGVEYHSPAEVTRLEDADVNYETAAEVPLNLEEDVISYEDTRISASFEETDLAYHSEEGPTSVGSADNMQFETAGGATNMSYDHADFGQMRDAPSRLTQAALERTNMDEDSSFDAEIEEVADPALSDISSEFSLLDLGSL